MATVTKLCEEPFRVFFVVGTLLGVIAVSLWPLYYAGWITFYPGRAHSRLMIEGFMAPFIIGFLGTAGPRITSTPHFSASEIFALLTLTLLAAGLHFGGAARAGDVTFLILMLMVAFALGKRFRAREDWPPPNFALVALGILNALIGATFLAAFENAAYSVRYRVGAMLLEQGFILFPILGVAPFLLPRLLDVPRSDELPEGRAMAAGWLPQAAFAAAIGLTINSTFILEACGLTSFAAWLRVGAIALYLAMGMTREGRTFLGNWLRVGLVMILAGFIAEALLPQLRIGALHVVFISGFGFIVMTVAIRVVFGHGGYTHLFTRRLPFFLVVAVLIHLAMISRYVAELAPAARGIHLVGAAVCWLMAAGLWAAKVLPKARHIERED